MREINNENNNMTVMNGFKNCNYYKTSDNIYKHIHIYIKYMNTMTYFRNNPFRRPLDRTASQDKQK